MYQAFGNIQESSSPNVDFVARRQMLLEVLVILRNRLAQILILLQIVERRAAGNIQELSSPYCFCCKPSKVTSVSGNIENS